MEKNRKKQIVVLTFNRFTMKKNIKIYYPI